MWTNCLSFPPSYEQKLLRGAHLLNSELSRPHTEAKPRPSAPTKAGRGPGLTDEHQQGGSHGGAVRKTELPQDLVGHRHRQGPREGRQQAQGPHGHVAAVFWKATTVELSAPCVQTEFRTHRLQHERSQHGGPHRGPMRGRAFEMSSLSPRHTGTMTKGLKSVGALPQLSPKSLWQHTRFVHPKRHRVIIVPEHQHVHQTFRKSVTCTQTIDHTLDS